MVTKDLWRSHYGHSSAANDGLTHAILAADVGDQLLGSGATGSPATAPGRRVFFFVSDFGFFDLTDDGKTLFNAAIDWAAASPGSGGAGGVPEPACASLAVVALFACHALRRRSRRTI